MNLPHWVYHIIPIPRTCPTEKAMAAAWFLGELPMTGQPSEATGLVPTSPGAQDGPVVHHHWSWLPVTTFFRMVMTGEFIVVLPTAKLGYFMANFTRFPMVDVCLWYNWYIISN